MEMYAIVTKHIEPPDDAASANLGKRPGSIVILRAMEECSILLFGNSTADGGDSQIGEDSCVML
jgi:hypothetical protein